jgi:hypothetical protein
MSLKYQFFTHVVPKIKINMYARKYTHLHGHFFSDYVGFRLELSEETITNVDSFTQGKSRPTKKKIEIQNADVIKN